MSENIKITIVMDDEKLNMRFGAHDEHSVIMTHDSSMTIMSTLLKNSLISGSFCGGRGDCGRCKIQFLKGMTVPTPLERSVMEPEELRQGYRLACLARPKDDCVIKLALEDCPKIDIVSDMIGVTENDDCMSQQKWKTEKHKSDVMESAATMIAVDLGTTTIAMHLMTLDTGQVMDTYCEMNPQRRYGADVLSRIKESCDGNRDILQKSVTEVLERGVSRFISRSCGQSVIVKGMCIAGNTTMEHLLMGYDVSSLGSSPFTPVEIGLQEYSHPAWDFPVWLAPGISTFVGGDIVAGLYALGMLPDGIMTEQAPVNMKNTRYVNDTGTGMDSDTGVGIGVRRGAALLIDLGTNGEMAITDGSRMIVTATAAGPAFEGGAGAGIVGSDMIACAASLLQKGIMDETGLLAEPYFTEGVTVGEPPVRLHNKDIRDLQLAKAAVRAGVEILWKQMGEPEIGHVWLAGGFGYYLNVDAAFRIGLLPEHMRGRVLAVGNTSLAGAFRIGRDLCADRIDKQTLERSISSIESINLAKQEAFERLYVQHIDFRQE